MAMLSTLMGSMMGGGGGGGAGMGDLNSMMAGLMGGGAGEHKASQSSGATNNAGKEDLMDSLTKLAKGEGAGGSGDLLGSLEALAKGAGKGAVQKEAPKAAEAPAKVEEAVATKVTAEE